MEHQENDGRIKTELTDKEEHYCQLRASGKTKTEAAKKAYDTQNPSKVAYLVELKPLVSDRIQELKEERAEAYGLDPMEQIRRYNELYQMAVDKGQLGTAAKMLERIDILGGFEAPTKSVSLRGNLGESLKDPNGNIDSDLKKFSEVLKTHSEKTLEGDYAETPKGNPEGSVH